MLFNHVALVCSSENQCDQFYQNVLGLEKLPSKILSPEMSEKIFGVRREYKLIYYGNTHLKFEIFLSSQEEKKQIGHVCLELKNREEILKKCAALGMEIIQIPRNGGDLVFIKDQDGHLFEMKEAQ